MRKKIHSLLVAGLLLAGTAQAANFGQVGCYGCSQDNQNRNQVQTLFQGNSSNPQAIYNLPYKEVSISEREDLIFMLEEEKLARDVYLFLYEKWGLPIFKNIAESEDRHHEAVKSLLYKYNIPDYTPNQVGVFQNSELQNLYYELTTKGAISIQDALIVGALIEEVDIKDLKEAITLTDNEDIRLVYENLMKGSRNHLRAFTAQLKQYNITYSPQYLSSQEYEEIINTSREMKGFGGQKMPNGNGFMGQGNSFPGNRK